ncbi:MAG TPA: hypothetical protein VI937_02775 [Negativicutes bacterium]|nr:hypothetical protein [Negativicutes bacterium]
MKKLVKILVGVAVATVILGAAGVAWSNYEGMRTKRAIERINSIKITMDDVMGHNLPPKPDQVESDRTIAGIDANGNFIRDDVELAIFEQYPDSAKTRAAMLQYAQAMQLELTQVFNSDVYIATIVKETNGSLCIVKTTNSVRIGDELEKLIINTDLRLQKRDQNAKNYLKTYLVDTGNRCDIEASLLLN